MPLQLFKRLFGEHATAQNHPLTRPLICPKCSNPMNLTLLVPFLSGAGGDTATYTCTGCGHEETRMMASDVS